MMQVIVQGRHVDITDWIREYIDTKVGKLERYLPQIGEARIELTHNATRAAADRYTAQLTMWANGQILRAEESTGDIFASIDATVDKMYRQIRRFKGRRFHGKRRAAAAASAEAEIAATMIQEEAESDEEARDIVRRKEFMLQPMTEDEALEQMELLGHDFFIYLDLEEQAVNVLYRRRDGHYGLLQPRVS